MKQLFNFFHKQFPSQYLFIIGLFLLLISPAFLTEGMFMDGLCYANIANNLAHGDGTFWDLTFGETHFHEFHGHPPLAMGIQSIFYQLFGDSFYVDKIYSVLTFFIVGVLIVFLWKILKNNTKNAWLSLLFWIIIPLVFWAATNNMLENTMSIFVISSTIFYFIGERYKDNVRQRFLYMFMLFLAGFMLFLAFLTKGFTGLYPLSLPLFYWIFKRKSKFYTVIIETVMILSGLLIPAFLLFSLNDNAFLFIKQYLDIQVIKGVGGVQTVNSRFFIIWRLVQELLVPIIVLTTCIIFGIYKKNYRKENWNSNKSNIFIMLSLGLSGVIPIMISMKQSGFYINTTFPFFAIAMGLIADVFIANLQIKPKIQPFIKYMSIGIFTIAIIINICNIGKIGREKEMLQDIHLILPKIPQNTIISIDESMNSNLYLHGYFARYKNISLDPAKKHQYLLLDKNKSDVDSSYCIIKTNTNTLMLYEKQ